jgi:hypothetical protein
VDACLGFWCPSRKPSHAYQHAQERSASYSVEPILGRAREWRLRGMKTCSRRPRRVPAGRCPRLGWVPAFAGMVEILRSRQP